MTRPEPTAEEIEAGGGVARQLRECYGVRGILILAAERGYITELRCAMPYCFAPDPREFDPLDRPLGPWMPTHEHFPLAKRFKGTRDVTNAVLAHRRCNNVGYKLEELREHLEAVRVEDGAPLRKEAVDAAMDDHVAERRKAAGRFPRSRGSRKRAERIALDAHRSLE